MASAVGTNSGTPRIEDATKGKEHNTQISIAESAIIALTEDSHEKPIKDQRGPKEAQPPGNGWNKGEDIRPRGAKGNGDPAPSAAPAGNNEEGLKDQDM